MKLERFYSPCSHLLTEPKFGRAKRIKIWINGESNCNEFCINPKNFRSWISILHHFSITLKPSFGAIRKLIALSSMRAVDCFEDLDPNEKYVALGASCRFRFPHGGYSSVTERDLLKQKTEKKFYKGEITCKQSTFLIESEKRKLTIIYILVNGKRSQTPQKAVFQENEMKNWNLILTYLSKILDIPEGIESLHTIFGDVVKNPGQLQHGFVYVAVPFLENFVSIDYISLFKKDNSFRKNYTLSISPSEETTKGTPICKKSNLSTYRIIQDNQPKNEFIQENLKEEGSFTCHNISDKIYVDTLKKSKTHCGLDNFDKPSNKVRGYTIVGFTHKTPNEYVMGDKETIHSVTKNFALGDCLLSSDPQNLSDELTKKQSKEVIIESQSTINFTNNMQNENKIEGPKTISIIEELSERTSTISDLETKEIFPPNKRKMFSTSSDSIKDNTTSEKKSIDNERVSCKQDSSASERLKSLFRPSLNIANYKNTDSEENIDSLFEDSTCDSQISDLYEDSVADVDQSCTISPGSWKNVKFESNQTTFEELAEKRSNATNHLNIKYSNPPQPRSLSCPLIPYQEVVQRQPSPKSFSNFFQKPVEILSMDFNYEVKPTCSSYENSKEQNNMKSDHKKSSTDSFSVEKLIVKTEDITLCEIGGYTNKSSTVFVLKEIEMAEYTKIIS